MANKSIKKIIMDNFFFENNFTTMESEEFLNDQKTINLLNYRKLCKQRSK